MKHALLSDSDWLRARYIDENLTLAQIADLAGVPNQNRTTVRRALLRAGIAVRSVSEAKTGRTHRGVPMSEEAKRKLSEAKTGKPNKTVWTPEMREALAAQRRGEANPMYGKPNKAVWTPEMREALAEQHRGAKSPHYGKPSLRRGPDYVAEPGERQRRATNKNRRGVSQVEYEALLVVQGSKCAICGKPEIRKIQGRLTGLSLDHSHKTTKARGLLCHRCNVLLGMAGDDPAILQAAIDYLVKHHPELAEVMNSS